MSQKSMLLKYVKTHVHQELADDIIKEVNFGGKSKWYPNAFSADLKKCLDEIIPSETEYFCQSAKLYDHDCLKRASTELSKHKIFHKHFSGFYVFGQTESCAEIIVGPNGNVVILHIDEDKLEVHNNFMTLNDFLENACMDNIDESDSPTILK